MVRAKVAVVTIVRDTVTVVATALLPRTVVGLPVLRSMPLPCYLLLLPLLWGVVCRLLDALPLGMLLLLLFVLALLGLLLLFVLALLGLLLLFLLALLFGLLLGMLLWLLLFRLLPGMLLWLLLFRLLLGMLLWLLLFRLLLGMLLWLLLFRLLLGMLLWLLLFRLLLGMLLWLLLFRLGFRLSLLCKGRNRGSKRQEQDCCSESCKCFHGITSTAA